MNDKAMKNSFTTSAGLEVEFEPIALSLFALTEQGIEKSFRSQGKPIDQPTYDVEVVGGDKISYPLTKDNLVVEGNEEETKSRQEKWNAHQDALNELTREKQRVQTLLMYDAIRIELPEDGVWEKRQKSIYIDVPQDPTEKKRHYIETEILKTAEDYITMTMSIMELSTSGVISEEALAEARASFQDSIRSGFQVGQKGTSERKPRGGATKKS